MIDKITKSPETIIGGISNSLTVFDPEEKWIYDERTNKSLSANHPWFGNELQGKVKYVFQKGQFLKVNA